MAPTGKPLSSPNQPSSEHATHAKPEKPEPSNDKPGEPQPKTAQSTDPAKGSTELTGPSTDKIPREAASEGYVSNEMLIEPS
jgi:hypothetical protein